MQKSNKPHGNILRKHSGNGNGDKFDHYVLQGQYGGSAKWEDLTAGESLDMILQSESDYRSNVPHLPTRIMSVWKTVSTGQEKRREVIRKSALYLVV